MSSSHRLCVPFRLGPRIIEPSLNRMRCPDGGDDLEIEPKVMEVLCVLAAHAGQVVTREQLLDEVWAGRVVVDEALTRCISALREALDDDATAPRFIQTIRKRGYRLLVEPSWEEIPPVRTREMVPAPSAPGPSNGGLVPERAAPLPAPSTSHPRFGVHPGLAAAALLIVLSIVAAVVLRPAPPIQERIESVAVLPLATGSEEDALVAAGFTHSLVATLVTVPDLKVIARESAELLGAQADPRAAGKRLGAAVVVHGMVRREADQLGVFARAVRVSDGQVLWAHRVRGPASAELELDEELTRSLLARFGATLQPGQATANLAAYRRYLEGRYLWNRRTAQSLDAAAARFEEAIALDPNYARAYAALSQTHLLRTFYASQAPSEMIPLAKAAASRALALDPSIGAAHAVLAAIRYQHEWDWQAAEQGFRRALELDPSDATTYQWYGELLQWRGRFAEARSQYSKALELEPLSLVVHTSLAGPALWGGNYREAEAVLRGVLELDPNFAYAVANLGLALLFRGEIGAALREFARAQELFGEGAVYASLAHAQALAGQQEPAREALRALGRHAQAGEYVAPFRFAVLHMALGETDAALDWLERGVAARDDHLVGLAVEPRFEQLHGHPRFAAILTRIGLADANAGVHRERAVPERIGAVLTDSTVTARLSSW